MERITKRCATMKMLQREKKKGKRVPEPKQRFRLNSITKTTGIRQKRKGKGHSTGAENWKVSAGLILDTPETPLTTLSCLSTTRTAAAGPWEAES